MKQPLTSACIMWVRYKKEGRFSLSLNWGLLVPKIINPPCMIEVSKELGWEQPSHLSSLEFESYKYKSPIRVSLTYVAEGWYDDNYEKLEDKYTSTEDKVRNKSFFDAFKEENTAMTGLIDDLSKLALGLTKGS